MLKQSPAQVPNIWDASKAPSDPLDLLVYASNLLGSDRRITNFGGGNTSSKVEYLDPLSGEPVTVLWVKASGGDLGSASRSNFASLYLDRLNLLRKKFERGGMHEDEAVAAYLSCIYNANPAAPSIDTPLHAFAPYACVSHMHSDSVTAIAASEDAERLTNEVFQGTIGYLPWKRPGLILGIQVAELIAANPTIKGAVMGSHGLICWANDWETCYAITIDMVVQAAKFIEGRQTSTHAFGPVVRELPPHSEETLGGLVPALRGRVAYRGSRLIAHIDQSEAVLNFTTREKMEALTRMGTSCPDHFLRTKIRPMILEGGASDDDIESALRAFRGEYEAYYSRCRHDDSPAMRNPNPSVVLLPGCGLVSFGRSKAEARITGEFYKNAIAVMEGAETISKYTALPEQEAFDIEYWALEEAKLRRMPQEKELARRIALVIGAGPGIGQRTAARLLENGAHVVLADVNEELVRSATEKLQVQFGEEVVSGAAVDVTQRQSVVDALRHAILTFGGVDIVVNLAAIIFAPDFDGRISDEQWKRTFDINVVGSYVVAEESFKVMKRQETSGSIVLVSSANAVVPKRGSEAYDASKAALNHLVRELAISFSPTVRINAVAPATVVEGSQMFPRDRVIASLTKYKVDFDKADSDDKLRDRLAEFYASRTLLKQAVTPSKIAEAAFLLAGDRLSQTTGQVIAVDAGLTDAFLR